LRWAAIFFLFPFVCGLAVSPSSVDRGSFYVFNTKDDNATVEIGWIGSGDLRFNQSFIELVSGEKRLVEFEVLEGGSGKILVKEVNGNGGLNVGKEYMIDYSFGEDFEEIVEENSFFTETGIEKITFTKPVLGKVCKISALFRGESGYFVLKGEVFVDDVFVDIVESDIFFVKENSSEMVNVYYGIAEPGNCTMHFKVYGEEFESGEERIDFFVAEDGVDVKVVLFIGLCCFVVVLCFVNIFIYLRKHYK